MGAGHNVLAAWLCVVAAWGWPQPRRINCAPLARDQNWSKVALWVSRSVTRPWSPRFLRRHVLGDVLTLKAPRAGLLLRPSDDGKYPHGKRICTTGSPSVSAVLSLDIRALGHDRPDSLQRFGEPATEAAGSNHREQCCRRLVAASVPLRRHATAERLGSPRLSAEDNGGDLDVWYWESALRPPRSVHDAIVARAESSRREGAWVSGESRLCRRSRSHVRGVDAVQQVPVASQCGFCGSQ